MGPRRGLEAFLIAPWGRADTPIVFGHYERQIAARAGLGRPWIGEGPHAGKLGIDTWAWRSGVLTAIRLPDRTIFQTSAADRG